MRAGRGAIGVEFELPDGWYCLDPHQPDSPDVLHRLMPPGISAPPVLDALCAADVRLALVHPGVPAITGAVGIAPPLAVSGAEVYRTLEEAGEAVGFGDLDGLPVVSLVRHAYAETTLVQITYLVCAEAATGTLTFAGPAVPDTKSVVGEVAHVLSGARVVRSANGCPV